MAKKTASLESGNAATVGAGLRHVFGSVGEQEKIYLWVMTWTVGKKNARKTGRLSGLVDADC